MEEKKERATARVYVYPSDAQKAAIEAARRGPGVIPADIIHEQMEKK